PIVPVTVITVPPTHVNRCNQSQPVRHSPIARHARPSFAVLARWPGGQRPGRRRELPSPRLTTGPLRRSPLWIAVLLRYDDCLVCRLSYSYAEEKYRTPRACEAIVSRSACVVELVSMSGCRF